mmetsp:Transcript_34763/g.87856  ORF Transcript_34763/g.87856 Transcript_34763/m.87856 type:complete len:338 (+) Transcript_34763:212-1225(+)
MARGRGWGGGERRVPPAGRTGGGSVGLLLAAASQLLQDHFTHDGAKDEEASAPLHLVERVAGVPEDRVDGGEDLAGGGDGGEDEGGELGDGVVDEALPQGAAQGEDEERLGELGRLLAQRHAVLELPGGHAEDEGDDGAREVGVEHRLEGRGLGVLGPGLDGVELLGLLLDLVLETPRCAVERQRAGNQGKAVGGVRAGPLPGLAGGAEVEDDHADGDDEDLDIVGEGVVLGLAGDEDAEEHDGDHLARLAENLGRVRHVSEGLVGRSHGKHLRGAAHKDLTDGNLEPGSAENHDKEEGHDGVDAALGDHHEERRLELLALIGLLEEVLLKHRKVGE